MKILRCILFLVALAAVNTRLVNNHNKKSKVKERQLVDEAKIIENLYENRQESTNRLDELPQFYKKSMKQRNLRLQNISQKYFANEKKWLQQQQQKFDLTKEQKKRILEENQQLEKIFNKNRPKVRKERRLTQTLPGEKKTEDQNQKETQSQTTLKVKTQTAEKKEEPKGPQEVKIKKIKSKYTIHSLYFKTRHNFQGLAGMYDHKQVDNPQFLVRVKDNPEESLKNTLHYIQNSNNLMEYYIKNFILTSDVINQYDQYSEKNDNPNYGTQDDMLKFYVAHQKNIAVRKYEKQFYKLLQEIYKILQQKNDEILSICHSSTSQSIFKEDVDNFVTLIEFVQKYFVYLKTISNSKFHHLDFDEEADKYNDIGNGYDNEHYKITHKDFKIDQSQRDKVPVQIMFQDIDELTQNINQNDPDSYIQQKLQRIPDQFVQESHNFYDQQLLEQQKQEDKQILDQVSQLQNSPLTSKTGTVENDQGSQNELSKDNLNLQNPKQEPFSNFNASMEKAKVDYALNNHHQNIEQLKEFRQSNKPLNANVPMNEVYGSSYTDDQIEAQLNKDSELNYGQNLKDEDLIIVQTPQVIHKDNRLSPVQTFDGYGEDIRMRMSNVQKFQNKKTVDQYQEMYNTFRNSSQVPFQEIKTHLDAQRNAQRRLLNQKLFTPPKGYQLRLPLRNDLAYLLQEENDQFDNVDQSKKDSSKIQSKSKSLFQGDLKNKWERKADKVYRELLKI